MTLVRTDTFDSFPKAALVVLALLGTGAQAGARDVSMSGESGTKSEIESFCTNIADAARDRRYLIQKDKLDTLKAEVDKRIAVMEKRRAGYQEWLSRRDAFLEKAQGGLVAIYTNMDADVAAEQLELLDTNVAAAVIMKLKPKQASAILNEMNAKSAAGLATIIASAGNPDTGSGSGPDSSPDSGRNPS